jgi:hypothetical protein
MHTLKCFHLHNTYMFRASLAHHQGVQLYKTNAAVLPDDGQVRPETCRSSVN